MIDTDTIAWREGVIGTLADIKAQLSRLASDRESEKETLVRVTQELHAEDRRQFERHERHVAWNDGEHEKIHEKVNKVSHRQSFTTGVMLTVQFILTLAVGVIALLK